MALDTQKYPELQVVPPGMSANNDVQKLLMVMRRQQLVDLATGYAVHLPNPDAPKPALLRIMLAAEEEGVFKRPPAKPFYVAKAMRLASDPPLAVEAPPEERVAAPGPSGVLSTGAQDSQESRPSVDQPKPKRPAWKRSAPPKLLDLHKMRGEAKRHGIPNYMNMKYDELKAAIAARAGGGTVVSQGD